jgi:hypothetical protein
MRHRILVTSIALALAPHAFGQGFAKLTPFSSNLDLLVVDTTYDGVWRLSDLNQDGDFDDLGEVAPFYDDAVGSIVLTNPTCIAVGPDETVYVADSTVDIVLALRDLNRDGDALDPGEHWVYFDSAANGSGVVMASAQGITVDATSAVLVASSSTSGSGDDVVIRLADLNADGDANAFGEALSYGVIQFNGVGALGDSIPTKVRVGPAGELYYTEVGSTGIIPKGVYRMRDDVVVNGNCNDPGEIAPYWIPSFGGNPFFWSLEVAADGTCFITDHGGDRILSARDLNNDGQIQAGTPEETLYYQIPGGSLMWDVLVREDGAILVAEDETPDRLMLYQDLDRSGVIDQPNEVGTIYDASVAIHVIRPRGAAFLRRPTLTATPNPVRLGQPVTLGFAGGPGSQVGLFASIGSIPAFALPPFGELELSPLGLSSVGVLGLSPAGAAALPLAIPIDPTLVGTIPLQSFELDPFRPHLSRRLDVQIRP